MPSFFICWELQSLFGVKGAALGLAAGAGTGAADVHAGGGAFVILIIGAVDHITVDVGLRLGGGGAGGHVAVAFAPLGEAVAAGVAFGVGGGAVHLDLLADAQVVLVVGAIAGVASQIAHDSKTSFLIDLSSGKPIRLFSALSFPQKRKLCVYGEKMRS